MTTSFHEDMMDAVRAYRDAQAYLAYMNGEPPPGESTTGASATVSVAPDEAVVAAPSEAVVAAPRGG